MPSTRAEVPEAERADFVFAISPEEDAEEAAFSWAQWATYHCALGQELAKRIRVPQ